MKKTLCTWIIEMVEALSCSYLDHMAFFCCIMKLHTFNWILQSTNLIQYYQVYTITLSAQWNFVFLQNVFIFLKAPSTDIIDSKPLNAPASDVSNSVEDIFQPGYVEMYIIQPKIMLLYFFLPCWIFFRIWITCQ